MISSAAMPSCMYATRERITRCGWKGCGTRTPEFQAWQKVIREQNQLPLCKAWCAAGGEGSVAFLRDAA